MKATKKVGESDEEGEKFFFIPFITIYLIRTMEMVPETKVGFFTATLMQRLNEPTCQQRSHPASS
jgi:hypothetical protein